MSAAPARPALVDTSAPPLEPRSASRRPRRPPPSTEHDALRLSDTGNAARFARQHGADLRYVHPWGAWMLWDGRRWTRDDTGEVMRRAKTTVMKMYADGACAPDSERQALMKHALRSDQKSRIEAMIALAQSEPGIPALPVDFDADPWALNVQNGTVDLRTAQLRPHRREDLITKLVPAAYDPDAGCDLWERFLNRILGGDQELIAFLQRAIGYTLTGMIREHCFFFLHGSGGNGKSTLIEVLRALFGELATHAEFATFLERKSERGPRDLARLFGARLVTAIEAGEGRRFDEAQLKSVTGGDTITACRLYEQAFEFRPTFKIWLAANHRPMIRGTDRGMWRRIRLIPFDVEIPEAEFDRDLDAKLLTELSGILAWAVAGALLWQREGLGAPQRVADATAEYRAAMDTFGDFLSERCEVDAGFSESAAALFDAYRSWADANGAPHLSRTALGLKLSERGFEGRKSGPRNVMWRFGLHLRADSSGQFSAISGNPSTSSLVETFQKNPPDSPDSPERATQIMMF